MFGSAVARHHELRTKTSGVSTAGKFLRRDNRRMLVCGTTYGPFRSSQRGEYGSPAQVREDGDGLTRMLVGHRGRPAARLDSGD